MVARIAALSSRLGARIAGAQHLLREAVELPGADAVLISDASSTGAKLPRDMSVKACIAGPPSMRIARVLPSLRVMDFARVAGRAGDVEHVLADARIEMPREADGQLVGIGRARLRIDQEAVPAHVIRTRRSARCDNGSSRFTNQS